MPLLLQLPGLGPTRAYPCVSILGMCVHFQARGSFVRVGSLSVPTCGKRPFVPQVALQDSLPQ